MDDPAVRTVAALLQELVPAQQTQVQGCRRGSGDRQLLSGGHSSPSTVPTFPPTPPSLSASRTES